MKQRWRKKKYNLQPFPSPCSKNTNIRHAQIPLIMFHRKFSRLFLKEWNWMLTMPFTKISSERQELSTTSKMQHISEKYGSRLSLYKNIRPMPPQDSPWWGSLWRWSRKVSAETYLSNPHPDFSSQVKAQISLHLISSPCPFHLPVDKGQHESDSEIKFLLLWSQ